MVLGSRRILPVVRRFLGADSLLVHYTLADEDVTLAEEVVEEDDKLPLDEDTEEVVEEEAEPPLEEDTEEVVDEDAEDVSDSAEEEEEEDGSVLEDFVSVVVADEVSVPVLAECATTTVSVDAGTWLCFLVRVTTTTGRDAVTVTTCWPAGGEEYTVTTGRVNVMTDMGESAGAEETAATVVGLWEWLFFFEVVMALVSEEEFEIDVEFSCRR